MTQGENVNPCPRKKTQKEKKIPKPRKGGDTKKKERKFPIKEWEKAKKERKILDQGSKEKVDVISS